MAITKAPIFNIDPKTGISPAPVFDATGKVTNNVPTTVTPSPEPNGVATAVPSSDNPSKGFFPTLNNIINKVSSFGSTVENSVQTFGQNVGIGVGKEVLGTAAGMESLSQKALTGVSKKLGLIPKNDNTPTMQQWLGANHPDWLKSTNVGQQMGTIGANIGEYMLGGEIAKGLESLPLIARMIEARKPLEIGWDILKGSSVMAGLEGLHGGDTSQIIQAGLEGAIPFGAVGAIEAPNLAWKVGRGLLAGVSEAAITKATGGNNKEALTNAMMAVGVTTAMPLSLDGAKAGYKAIYKKALETQDTKPISAKFINFMSSLKGSFNSASVADKSVLDLFENRGAMVNSSINWMGAIIDKFVKDVPNVADRTFIYKALDNPDQYLSQLSDTGKNYHSIFKNLLEEIGNFLQDEGVIKGTIHHFAPRILDIEGSKASFKKGRSVLTVEDALGNILKKTKYPTIDSLEAAGLKLKTTDLADIIPAYVQSVTKALQDKYLAEEAKKIAIDGLPASVFDNQKIYKSVESASQATLDEINNQASVLTNIGKLSTTEKEFEQNILGAVNDGKLKLTPAQLRYYVQRQPELAKEMGLQGFITAAEGAPAEIKQGVENLTKNFFNPSTSGVGLHTGNPMLNGDKLAVTGSQELLGLKRVAQESASKIEADVATKTKAIQKEIDSLKKQAGLAERGGAKVLSKTRVLIDSKIKLAQSRIKGYQDQIDGLEREKSLRARTGKGREVGTLDTKIESFKNRMSMEANKMLSFMDELDIKTEGGIIPISAEDFKKKIGDLQSSMIKVQNEAGQKIAAIKEGKFFTDANGREFYEAGDINTPSDYKSIQTNNPALNNMRFHPKAAPLFQAQFNSTWGDEGWQKSIANSYSVIRRIKFVTPNVHFLNLIRNESAVSDLTQIPASLKKANDLAMNDKGFQEEMARSGVQLFKWERQAQESFVNLTGEAKSTLKIPFVGKLTDEANKVADTFDKFLFDYTGDSVNASIAKTVGNILQDRPGLNYQDIRKIVGDVANNFSGQVPKYTIGSAERFISKILLAPRWNISNFRMYFRSLGIGYPSSWTPEMVNATEEIYRNLMMKSFTRLFTFAQYANWSVTSALTGQGRFTWDNPVSDKTDIQKKVSPALWIDSKTGNYYSSNIYGYLGDALQAIHAAISGNPNSLFNMAGNKLHPLISEMAQQLGNRDFFTGNNIRNSWEVSTTAFINNNVWASLEHAGVNFSPIGGTGVFQLFNSKATTPPEVSLLRTLGIPVATNNSQASKYYDIKDIETKMRSAAKTGDTTRLNQLLQDLRAREQQP